ncbi:hypothetical protein ABPG74_010609 [Tetrahymena malaccensis]
MINSHHTSLSTLNKENKSQMDKSYNKDDSMIVDAKFENLPKKYQDDKLNKVLQTYIKNPQILINEEKEIKERFLAKQKKDIAAAKQKFDTKNQLQQFELENQNTQNSQQKAYNNLSKEEVLVVLQKQNRKSQANTVLADNSNIQNEFYPSCIKPKNPITKKRQSTDYSKKNADYLENLNIQQQSNNKDLINQQRQTQQDRNRADNSQNQDVQARLYERTELQKLRIKQKEEEQANLKNKRQKNRSQSIEQNVNFMQNDNQKLIDRHKEYLKQLKQQVNIEKETQKQLKQKDEENKIRLRNSVLASIKNDLTQQRKLILENHNLFLSKSTVSQSAKQISLPEINQSQTICLEKQKSEVEQENKAIVTSQAFFRQSSLKDTDEVNEKIESKTNLSKVKKLRPLPFISSMVEWKKKQRIPSDSKIFIVMGGYKDFKKALLKRGWIENPQTNSPCFDLKWTLLGKDIDYDNILPNQIVNHFENNSKICSKIGLLNSLKNLYWFDNADLNSFFPQCFDMNDPDEFNDFVKNFKLSKAISVLKKYLRLFLEKDDKYNNYKIQAQVALQVLTRYFNDVNNVIDDEKQAAEYFKSIPDEEWEILASDEMSNEDLAKKKHFEWIKKIKLAYQGIKVKAQVKKKKKKSQAMIKKMIQNDAIKRKQDGDKQQSDGSDSEDEEVEMDDFTSAVNQFLNEREKCDPQFNLKGEDNIWIVKPAGLSRGRGITCYKNLVEIIDHAKSMELQMIVQKYIENPVLIQQRKFDIRIWVLVTDWNPLAIWYFDECYIRFSADSYSTKNLSNKFQHLTNNAISKKKAQQGQDEITLQGNMYTQEQLENFFIETEGFNVFQQKIKPQIINIIKWSILSCSDTVESRKNSMELFGYDIMIDTNFNPWLLEVNTSPSLEYSTEITKKLVKQVLEDVAKVVVDYGMAQKSGVKKSELQKISTGKFIKVYQGQEIQDKGINSLQKNFICEGSKMRIRKPKKQKKLTKIAKKQNQQEDSTTNNQINDVQKQLQTQTSNIEKYSRPQTAKSQSSKKL